MEKRTQKQVLVAVIFFVLLGGASFGLFRVIVPPKPSPTPNPTINLAPIKILSTTLIPVASGDYDFVARVNDPNIDYGSGNVSYDLDFLGADNTVLAKKTFSFFILPGQTKYVVNTPLRIDQPLANVRMTITSVDWQKLDQVSANGVNIVMKNISDFQPSQQAGSFGRVGGNLMNNSDIDLNMLNAVTVLSDENNQPIAVNSSEIRTFLAQTTRGFEAIWYTPFSGTVSHIDVEAQTNLFENSNFLRQYGGNQQKFQQLY